MEINRETECLDDRGHNGFPGSRARGGRSGIPACQVVRQEVAHYLAEEGACPCPITWLTMAMSAAAGPPGRGGRAVRPGASSMTSIPGFRRAVRQ